MLIRDFLEMLTDTQRERLARIRKVEPDSLPNSYKGDWVKLIRDLTPAEMHRALKKTLSDDDLRVVTLRAFDGRRTTLDDVNWKDDGTAPKRRQAVRIVEDLCNWAPEALQRETWRSTIVPMLRDAGIEADRTPEARNDLIGLRRIFSSSACR